MSSNLGLPMVRPVLSTERRRVLSQRIRWFVAATISYNVIEAVIAITEGARVSSTALIGFGMDSVIEVSSAAAVAWQFAGVDPEKRERVALRIIAFSFFGLATYVTVESVRALVGVGEAEHSGVGIVLAAVSLLIMPVLSWAQRRAGRELGSLSAVADSKQTLLCTYLSAVLLAGLLLNSLFGWVWADPMAGLIIAAIAVREGVSAWNGDSCCPAPTAGTAVHTAPARHDCCDH
ncbi:cation transporter [Rhodococcus gannanensis]|uniref:Cation transporter n=1 Tax=Rhodococcus gannanensis TaxID=1960308 RepID=A0ABW4P0S2_9NOCA